MQVDPLSARQRLVKRALDLIVAVLGLLLLGPFIFVGWLLATFSTRSNGFFTQDRVGRNGKLFRVIKLRTMRAHQGMNATTVTVRGDERITPIGRFLRRSKMDELPQLINVVRGEMSLVGPRPDVSGFADCLEGSDRVLLTLRPGITGPASLYYRDEESELAASEDPEKHNRDVVWPNKVRMNLQYLSDWSLTNDIGYIWTTVRGAVVSDRSAL